jgi:hypothetical protein
MVTARVLVVTRRLDLRRAGEMLGYTLDVRVVPMWVKAFEIAVLREFMLTIAPRLMRAATMAYSIMS